MTKDRNKSILAVHKQEGVDSMNVKKSMGRDIFKVKGKTDDGKIRIESDFKKDLPAEDAYREFQTRVHEATGCVDLELSLKNISMVSDALTKDLNNTNDVVENLNRVTRSMASFEPKDEIEGQLVAQLVVLHEQSMYWLGRAMRTDRVDFASTYLNASTKLVNRHHETLKTLIRYRQGGDQKIIVENVNVNQGGQAIVGHVTGGRP